MRDEEAMKSAVKEALKEWLDEKFSTFGKWAAASLAALVLAAFVLFVLWANGWKQP
jgi:hypothetical protein